MSSKISFNLLLLIKIVVFVLFYLVVQRFIPPHYFLLKESLGDYGLSGPLSFLGSHDGAHYLSIAKNGYNTYEQAFFPLFPIIINILGRISMENYFPMVIILNIICALLSIHQLKILTGHLFPHQKLNTILSWWIVFPTSFFFFVVYNESIFFLFSLIFLNSIYSKKHKTALLFGFLAASTRLVGVFLVIPAIFQFIQEKKITKSLLISFSGPILGLIAYMIYLFQKTGDPIFFFSAQPSFGANRSTHIILLPQVIFRYLKIFFTANHDFVYFVAIMEMIALIVGLFCLWKCYQFFTKMDSSPKKNFLLLIIIFSSISYLLPTLTGTLSSLPRYLLTTPLTYWGLALIDSKKQFILLLISLMAQFVLFSLFSSGYFLS